MYQGTKFLSNFILFVHSFIYDMTKPQIKLQGSFRACFITNTLLIVSYLHVLVHILFYFNILLRPKMKLAVQNSFQSSFQNLHKGA